MKIADIKAAVDRLHTTECQGIVVNSEALKELRELLSTPVVERKDALDAACALLDKVHCQGDMDWRIREDVGHFLEQRQEMSVERQDEPFGYWMHPNGLPQIGMFHKPDPDIESASVKEFFEATALYTEQPETAALRAELERYKAGYARLGGTIEKVADVALRNKDEGEILQKSLADTEQRNVELVEFVGALIRRIGISGVTAITGCSYTHPKNDIEELIQSGFLMRELANELGIALKPIES